ncbi:MAG: cytochrome c biogenesis protein ResB [Chloroflexi bacterium]|jgi:cytochrome c biogenesis protein|nr:cytochrome c biogenesis protein ResB [Chloroflexota bacterium]
MTAPRVALPAGARALPARGPLNAPARLGRAIYGLLTSVRFAVVQIVAIAVAGVIGIIVPQLPGAALRSPADYAEQMEILRARVEPSLGLVLTDVFEALGFFRVFSAWWFTALLALLAVSIVVCTLDRTPRLWRSAREVRVAQPDAFYDPALPDRAVIVGGLAAADVRAALRRSRFRVREAEGVDGGRYLYGDRNQNAKLFTLISHAGLVGFILAAAITSRMGFESGILLPEGQAIPVQSIGTAGLVSIKNLGFSAPRDETGRFSDFTTDLAVYQGGREIARKTIRVNDPLEAAGYTFHQNFFGPAADLTVRDGAGRLLWAGPVPLDEVNAGRPYGRFTIPGRDEGIELLLDAAEGKAPLLVMLGFRPIGGAPDGELQVETTFVGGAEPGRTYATPSGDLSIAFEEVTAYSGVIVKRDPGASIVWISFALLIVGLSLTFYFPRRRVWAHLAPSGELRLVARADRYVDLRREFSRLLEDLVARRRPA